jgi:peptidyl-prolyl cis-trans isomerase B (cyclophilin B)
VGTRVAAAALVVAALAGCGGSGSAEKSSTETPGLQATTTSGTLTAPPASDAVPADAVVKTSEGTFTIALAPKVSPNTVASFEMLARKGFFDGTTFHRIVPGFVIQGGDPTGSGSGGPGYTVVDTPPASTKYTRGVVAMAKTQTEAPGTSGSQFFVVTGADVGLPPEYAVLGEVTSGLDTVMKIDKLGDRQTEQPTKTVTVEKVTIRPT